MKKTYFGKQDPRGPEFDFTSQMQAPDPHDAIFDRRKASLRLACEILGVSCPPNLQQSKIQYKALCLRFHPDHNGQESTRRMQQINSAWSYIQSCF